MNRVAIIVAMTDDCPDLDARIARFVEEAGPSGKVILVDATTRRVARLDQIRHLRRPPGTLVPDLWRDGLDSTDAPLVAFTTAHMNPCRGWLTALTIGLESSGSAASGGPIEPAHRLSNLDRAVALLRYSSYFPPLPDPSRIGLPGENALYRRDRLIEVESSWSDGFWEVGVQKALRAQGHSMSIAHSAVVTFEGGTTLLDMVRRRFAHAWNYGEFRSNGASLEIRIARVLMSPIVPMILALRALSSLKVRRLSICPWLASLPNLLVLASAWAVGEAIGASLGLRKSKPTVQTPDPVKSRPCKDQS